MSNHPIKFTGIPLNTLSETPDTPNSLTELTWLKILENMQIGVPLRNTLKDLDISHLYIHLLRQIKSNEAMETEYDEANKIQCFVWEAELADIAMGVSKNNSPFGLNDKDDKTRIVALKALLQANDRSKWGNIVDNSIEINIIQAMNEAEKRITTV